jgi:dephospho-CoA kinase
MKIALTGMIASGKTEVLKELEKLGWLALAADKLAWQAAESPEAKIFLKDHFGDRKPEKEEIRRKFIDDEKFRAGWEGVLHPKVNSLWREFISNNARSNIAIEIPLLFEKRLETGFGKVVVCSCDTNLALSRWQMKGGRKEDYQALAGFLMPIESKLKKADFVVENNTTLDDLRGRVHELHKQLLKQ